MQAYYTESDKGPYVTLLEGNKYLTRTLLKCLLLTHSSTPAIIVIVSNAAESIELNLFPGVRESSVIVLELLFN